MQLCTGRFRLAQTEAEVEPISREGKRRKLSNGDAEENGKQESEENFKNEEDDVLVGCEDGFVYWMSSSNYKLTRFAKVGFPPLKMASLPAQPLDLHRKNPSRVCSTIICHASAVYSPLIRRRNKRHETI